MNKEKHFGPDHNLSHYLTKTLFSVKPDDMISSGLCESDQSDYIKQMITLSGVYCITEFFSTFLGDVTYYLENT